MADILPEQTVANTSNGFVFKLDKGWLNQGIDRE